MLAEQHERMQQFQRSERVLCPQCIWSVMEMHCYSAGFFNEHRAGVGNRRSASGCVCVHQTEAWEKLIFNVKLLIQCFYWF